MKIGIISDTHDNLLKLEKAVKFFNRHKVGFVLHAGDFVAPFTMLKLEKLYCDWRGVFGNNDGEREGLISASGGKIKAGPQEITLGKRKITLAHDINTLNLEAVDAQLIIAGHTHKTEIKELEGKLIVNPGECGGWLTGKSTVALLDLACLKVRIYKI